MREVEKIDIHSEKICIENDVNYLEFFRPETGRPVNSPSDKLACSKDMYYIYDYAQKDELSRYLAIKDEILFQVLLNISKERLKELNKRAYLTGYHDKTDDLQKENCDKLRKEQSKHLLLGIERGIKYGEENERYRIKNLSWIKRLFNKF